MEPCNPLNASCLGLMLNLNSGLPTNPFQVVSVFDLLTSLVNVAIFIGGVTMFLCIIISGLQWMFAGGNSQVSATARSRVLNCITGFAILAVSYALVLLIQAFLGIEIFQQGPNDSLVTPTPSQLAVDPDLTCEAACADFMSDRNYISAACTSSCVGLSMGRMYCTNEQVCCCQTQITPTVVEPNPTDNPEPSPNSTPPVGPSGPVFPPGPGPIVQPTVIPGTLGYLQQEVWQGSNVRRRNSVVELDGTVDWSTSSDWTQGQAPPIEGTVQSQVIYQVGNNMIKGVWIDDQGWVQYIPVINDVILWGQPGEWIGPIALGSMPGSGSVQAHGDYVVGNTLIQGIWQNNEGWTRTVPIANGQIQWNLASPTWGGPISISTMPGSGDMQAQDNWVVKDTYWQVIWRNNQQWTRTLPIVNNEVQWSSDFQWINTTAQMNLSDDAPINAQSSYVFP